MIFRLSQKLSKKIKAVHPLDELPLDENPFADWSAHLFTTERTQYIILTNTKSLYSCVMHAKGINSVGGFIEAALKTIRDFMQDDAEQFVHRKFIVPASKDVMFAKALNRSVIGTMTELIGFADMLLAEDELSPHEVGFKLNNFLLTACATDKRNRYGTPKEAFRSLADEFGQSP